jgi:hypothetical protein
VKLTREQAEAILPDFQAALHLYAESEVKQNQIEETLGFLCNGLTQTVQDCATDDELTVDDVIEMFEGIEREEED